MADPALIAARFAMLALLLVLAGVPFHLRLVGFDRVEGAMRLLFAVGAAVAMVASGLWAVTNVAVMAAMPVGELDQAMVLAVLDATPLGDVLHWRLIALAGFLLVAIVFPRTVLLAVLGLTALGVNAWTGHAGAVMGTIGSIQRLFDVVHLAAASLWLGALVHFVRSASTGRLERTLVERLTAFARTGTAVVILLTLTGAANAVLIGREGWQIDSSWSLLLLVKLALFVAMLGFAALNRWRLTPAFDRGEAGARRRLTVSLILETTCMFLIVALVSVLGLLNPGGA
ncbi:CopD family protein [Altererythrobacter sp.]|uniref:CopD family protein n=1 Tax=Altererythrobacter sp. TaxID=1872480 RepID=UPI003CFFA784